MDFVASENLSSQIARHLTFKIIRSELMPGERIHEIKLASELNVSRAPIREALQILRKNWLVELMPRRGARVTPLSAQFVTWLYDILIELYSILARR